jgi:hypothetical protein
MPFRRSTQRTDRGALLAKLGVGLGLLALVGVLGWVFFLPRIVAGVIRAKTGFVVQVDQLSVNPFSATVALSGLVVRNPEGWPSGDFLEVRAFRANAELFSLFSDHLVADEVFVDVPQLTLVRNQQGVLNAVALKDGFKSEAKQAQTPKKPAPQFLIKRLSFKFGRLVYADYSKGGKPDIRDYDVNLTRELRDVDSVAKLIDPFRGTLAMGVITDTLTGLFKNSPDLLKQLTDTIQDAGKKTGEVLKGLLQSLEKKKS